MTKREVLMAICEHPGWQPPHESSAIERFLGELRQEGLVIERIDGFEATSEALESYPAFAGHPDIADPTPASDPEPQPELAPVSDLALERVQGLLYALLKGQMAIGTGEELVARALKFESQATRDANTDVTALAARLLAKRLLETRPQGGRPVT